MKEMEEIKAFVENELAQWSEPASHYAEGRYDSLLRIKQMLDKKEIDRLVDEALIEVEKCMIE